jgi:hypothetical protein
VVGGVTVDESLGHEPVQCRHHGLIPLALGNTPLGLVGELGPGSELRSQRRVEGLPFARLRILVVAQDSKVAEGG